MKLMCGIVGIRDFRSRRIEPRVGERMRDALHHRGPDDEGLFADERKGVVLGNRRLAILDLSAQGHMPMANRTKTLWITHNGEIYNFREVRKELEERGHVFSSSSDTEVILGAYEEWGMSMLEKFRGMFAFVLWDAQKEELFLVRDRVGVKPLYWYFKDGLLLFASELKAFHEHPDFKKELNLEAFSLFLQFGYIPSPQTIFQHTFKVKPGHIVKFSKEGRVREESYWDIAEIAERPLIAGSQQETEEELEDLLMEAFQYRMVSDVPVGVFLSGGVDSSLVTALVQFGSKGKLKTFSIGFREKGYDEAPHAKKVAEFLGTDHHELYCTKETASGIIPHFADLYDEPSGDSSGIPTFLLSRFAREEVTVALSGDGGDELFGGYPKYRALEWYYKNIAVLPGPVRSLAARALGDKFFKVKRLLRLNAQDLSSIFWAANSYWAQDDLAKLLQRSSERPGGIYGFDKMQHRDVFSRMQIADFRTYLSDGILAKIDRATMAVGLEGREPFLDHKLVEYAMRIPSSLKFRGGQGKHILKRILSRHVPPELTVRPKQGFGVPVYEWLAQDFKEFLHVYLAPERLKRHNLFYEEQVTHMKKGFERGRKENAYQLWLLLMFQLWYERWMETA